MLHPVGGIDIPAIACSARTTARLMVGQVRPGARIVCLLRFPCYNPALYIDFPRATTGAVHTVGRADNLVMLPPLAIAVFPSAVLAGGDTVTIGIRSLGLAEKIQSVEKMAHFSGPLSNSNLDGRGTFSAPFYIVEQTSAPGIIKPGHHSADNIKDHKTPKRSIRRACHIDRTAIGFGNEERPVSSNCGRESDNRCRFLFGVTKLFIGGQAGHQASHFLTHDDRDHLESRSVADTGGKEQQHEHCKEAPKCAGLILYA